MAEDLQNELINFMFLRDCDGRLDVLGCVELWFGKSNETDIEIKTRFGEQVEKAIQGGYTEWERTPRGCLALMILVDQFPRNIYRHTVRMFDGNTIGRRIVEAGHDWLEVLRPEECLFAPCLILTHQEDLQDQETCLQFYETLEPHLQSELRVFRTIFEEHHRIISICGAFPHRDHYHRRTTSKVGRMLMDNPKLRFDLPLTVENGTVKFGRDPRKLWHATQLAFDVLERIDALADQTARRRSSTQDCLSAEKIAEYHEVFRIFDKDGDGFFDHNELAAVLTSTGRPFPSGGLQKAVDRITGRDGSAGITFEQFTSLLRVKMRSDWETRIRRRFAHFDVDGSGEISIEELKKCMEVLNGLVTSAEIEDMMKKCDIDGDGVLSYEEFFAMAPTLRSVEATPVSPVFDQSLWDRAKPVSTQVQVSEVESSDTVV
jgi:uncharacterized protein (DUF924 family)/Ca2+-binding EF-hand superfamily protein